MQFADVLVIVNSDDGHVLRYAVSQHVTRFQQRRGPVVIGRGEFCTGPALGCESPKLAVIFPEGVLHVNRLSVMIGGESDGG